MAAYTIAADVEDVTSTGSGNFAGTGNALANTMTGGAGNDTLDGGAGNDRLVGLAGDDTYRVDSASDTVVEAANGGTDTVLAASASYTLSAQVEILTFTGTGTFNGVGNTQANVITGGVSADTLAGGGGTDTLRGQAGDDVLNGDGGNDTLDGGLGADTMGGGTGNDIYLVDNALDAVLENQNAGIDEVRSSLQSYTLGVNVENFTFTGAGGFAGTGNTLQNTMVGGNGADILNAGAGADQVSGLGGNDVLTGGTGNDTFVFRPGFGNDTVTDFLAGTPTQHDTLDLRGNGFASIQAVLDSTTDAGSNAVIQVGADSITLQSVTRAQLQEHDFII